MINAKKFNLFFSGATYWYEWKIIESGLILFPKYGEVN
jgi:hypothetical protein